MDEELQKIARSLVWWKSPEAVSLPYLVRRTMDMGTLEMLVIVRLKLGDRFLREALADAEPGNFSDRSWSYCHVVFGIRPTPPLPQRVVPDSPHVSSDTRRATPGPADSVAQAG
jgi:hypothetical protein